MANAIKQYILPITKILFYSKYRMFDEKYEYQYSYQQ